MMDKPGWRRRDVLGAGIAVPLVALTAPARALAEACAATPRLTAGPFFPSRDQADKDIDLTRLEGHAESARGLVIRVEGRVLDEACRPVEGAQVVLWQADANGRYAHPADRNPARRDPNFQGWGQALTDADGRYAFRTIKPAAYPMAFIGGQADESAGHRTPHIHFRVVRDGYRDLTTQMFFDGEALNESDFVLANVPRARRPAVVIAPRAGAAGTPPYFPFDFAIGPA